MQINYFGATGDFFANAFVDSLGSVNLDTVSSTPAQLVLRNPFSGYVVTVTGSGLSDPNITVPSGTMTGMTFTDAGGTTVATFSGFSWGFSNFVSAIVDNVENGNAAPLNGLFSLQPVTLDASMATTGGDFEFDGITSTVTITGSNFNDTIEGGSGNDLLNPGDNAGGSTGFDLVAGSTGNDTIDFGNITNGFVSLDYNFGVISGAVTVNVNGAANT